MPNRALGNSVLIPTLHRPPRRKNKKTRGVSTEAPLFCLGEMPRNRSEQRPHPELPDKFHERLRLWMVLKRDGLCRDGQANDEYQYCRGTFSSAENTAYENIDWQVYCELKRYYDKQARKKENAA